jgi:hypothetical protein
MMTSALSSVAQSRVLFAPCSGASAADLNQLVAAATASARSVGFIHTWGRPDAVTAQLRRWAGSDPDPRQGTLAASQFRFSGLRPGGDTRFHIQDHAHSDLLAEVSRGYRTLGLVTHSNGLDADLGAAVMCTLAHDRQRIIDGPFLPCAGGGPCLRARPADGVLDERPLFSPRLIAAETLIWQTCFGVPGGTWTFDSHQALINDVLATDRVRNVLTTYRVADADDAYLLYALALLDAGHTLGEVCLILNTTRARRGRGTPWILVGDPLWRDESGHPATAVSAGTENGATVAFESAGIRLVHLPDSTGLRLSADMPASDQDRGDLLLRRVPGTSDAVVVHTGPAARNVTLFAHDQKAPLVPAEVVAAIWEYRGNFSASRRLAELAERQPKGDTVVPVGLVERLTAEVEYQAIAVTALSRDAPILDGPA